MTTKKCTQKGLIITWLHGSAVNNHLSGHNDEASSIELIKKNGIKLLGECGKEKRSVGCG